MTCAYAWAHLGSAPGARPSPGAGSLDLAAAFDSSEPGRAADVAAPEDGRAPGAVSRCAHSKPGVSLRLDQMPERGYCEFELSPDVLPRSSLVLSSAPFGGAE